MNILTEEDLDMVKEKSLKLLDLLPGEPKSAQIILAFLSQHITDETGIKIKGIKIE